MVFLLWRCGLTSVIQKRVFLIKKNRGHVTPIDVHHLIFKRSEVEMRMKCDEYGAELW